MTRLEFVIDTPYIIADKIWPKIKGAFKVFFSFNISSVRVYCGVDSLVSFRLSMNYKEFSVGAFNLMLWIVWGQK